MKDSVRQFKFFERDDISRVCPGQSICVISDGLTHSTAAVYSYQERVLPVLKSVQPGLRKIHYFTDGCAAQYKNKKNFLNMCHHEKDFSLECEWHFFATCHGKGPCDGVGGTVKRLTARASLQRSLDDQILTARDMYQFCTEHISGWLLYSDAYF